MIKFKHMLIGYGFDVAADRVVRFTKHPEGTYLNTRATYDVNGRTYSHHALRGIALSLTEPEQIPVFRSEPSFVEKHKVKLIVLAIVFALLSMAEWSFTVDIETDEPIAQTT